MSLFTFAPLGRGSPETLEAKGEHPEVRRWLAFYRRESSWVTESLCKAAEPGLCTGPGLLWRCTSIHSDMLSHICTVNFYILLKPLFVSCNVVELTLDRFMDERTPYVSWYLLHTEKHSFAPSLGLWPHMLWAPPFLLFWPYLLKPAGSCALIPKE